MQFRLVIIHSIKSALILLPTSNIISCIKNLVASCSVGVGYQELGRGKGGRVLEEKNEEGLGTAMTSIW